MKRVFAQYKNWLLPAVLILFILQAVTFPFALGKSWAGRSEMPDHLLTCNMKGHLVWDSETEVDDNGVAQLNLFASKYGDPVTVDSGEDGSKLVAPGTNKETIVRLYNKFINNIVYKVVLYQYQENIPEKINMRDKLQTRLLDAIDGLGFADDTKPVLPEGVTEDQVIRAVTGKISSQKYQDFDINWLWDFEAEGKDGEDTLLGSLTAEGKDPSTTLGMYIVAQPDTSGSGDVITPEASNTGDSGIGVYLGLMAVCGGLLMLLQWEKRKARQCEE